MDYIQLIEDGCKIICNYKEPQTDYCENYWTEETWYKSDDIEHKEKPYICVYSNGFDYSQYISQKDFKFIFKDIIKMQENNEVNFEIEYSNSTSALSNSNINTYKWTEEQVNRMYDCLLNTYPLIKRFVDETFDLSFRDKELLSDAKFWLAGFENVEINKKQLIQI